MTALDNLLSGPPPSLRKRPPADVIDKIIAARERGFSFQRIADALRKDGVVTCKETVSRWVREHHEREG